MTVTAGNSPSCSARKTSLWWDLPARESFELNAKIYGIPSAAMERTVAEMSELLGVREKLNVSVRELSLGERTKMELIASLLHQPKVLFLDEPTIGLDVVSQKIVREFLREHNARYKTTILLTSHYMTDIQELCHRVIIIDHGRIFFDGRLGEILDRFADSKLVTIQCEGATAFSADHLAQYGEIVEQNPGAFQLKGQARPRHSRLQSPPRRTPRQRHRHPGSPHRGGHPPYLCPVTALISSGLPCGFPALNAFAPRARPFSVPARARREENI